MINRIIEFVLKHRVLAIFLVLLVCLFGVISYLRLPKDIYPDLNAPLVNIITENPGMASEEVERLITFQIESLMAGTPGVTRIRSESTTGNSLVTVEFDWGTDIYLARQVVSSKLDLVSGRLPVGTTPPILGPISSRMGEVFEFVITGDKVDPMELRTIADWTVRRRLQGVTGVSYIINLGGYVRQFQILLKPEMLYNYRLTIDDVRRAVELSNRNFSGGIMTRGAEDILIKGIGRISSLEDISRTVVASRNNIPVYAGDVAEVKIGHKFRREDAGHNGQEAVYVTMEKQYGSDTLSTIANIKKGLGEIKRDLPAGIIIKPIYDQSILIIKSIQHLEFSVLEGIILVILIMVLFMGEVRSALIASLTIPFSILIALLAMGLFGVKLTVMSIGGLAIGIGKMANGSIILVENILRAMQEKKGKASIVEIAGEASRDVGNYLFSASLIIILVFVPMLTMKGLEGAMFRPTAFAVAASLFGAMMLNLTFQPVLATYFLTDVRENHRKRITDRLQIIYEKFLRKALDRKKLLLSIFIFLIVVALVCYTSLGKEFVPPLDEGSMIISTTMLPETSLEEAVRVGKEIEKMLLKFPEVASVSRTTGSAEGSEHIHPVNHCHFLIELLPREKRKKDFKELSQAIRQELEKFPGLSYIIEQPIANKLAEMLTGTEGQLSIKLFGPDLNVLNEKIGEIKEIVRGIRGAADVQVEQTRGIPELVIKPDREKLARYGLSIGQVAEIVETAFNGLEVTDVYEQDRITSVLIRLPETYRQDEEALKNLLLDSPSGEKVPLALVADISRSEGPQTIFRENMMRRKIILANVVKRDLGGFVEEVQEAIEKKVDLPRGYFLTFGGQFESQQHAMKHLTMLIAVVLLIVFVILFSSFGSIWQALLIILNIPSTLIGGIIGLLVAGQSMNVSSTIGLIALFGICAQNDIVLVGKINDFRKKGMSLRQAVIEGALTKFRPIFITDMVMIVSVLPLALIRATGSELHRPLATVYIGGFFLAILLRLLIVPVLYELFAQRFGSKKPEVETTRVVEAQ
ncbi:MAG: efflux RND transporter permease subunit [Candidatus Saccharicenans sp.]|uniref:efflux RND transporter permease subunit n=1 Tax=Candidatus Saccharicenans sp. TaxID=2819258 RepID=UPI00404AD716